jgi:plasmid maintenance system killer protein
MVLAFLDNHDDALPIPAGGTFELVGPDHDDRFLVIRVNGQEFLIFQSDLAERATQLEPVFAEAG